MMSGMIQTLTMMAVLSLTVARAAEGPVTDDWPGLRGPLGTGVMPARPGLALAVKYQDGKALRNLKPRWVSEAQDLPIGWGFGVGPPTDDVAMRGGYCGPVHAAGKVFIYYTEPNPSVVDGAAMAASKAGTAATPGNFAVLADDVVLAVDAATGKTAWRFVRPKAGINVALTHLCIWTYPCVSKGKVYVSGATGLVYCLDAASGKLIWEMPCGPGRAAYESLTAERVKTTKKVTHNEHWGSARTSPALIGDVLVVGDDAKVAEGKMRHNQRGAEFLIGMSGLDPDTGKLSWHLPEILGHTVSPARWVHQGAEYIVATCSTGITCVEPATGKVRWKHAMHASDESTPAISGDLFVQGGRVARQGGQIDHFKGDEPGGLFALRLTPEGPQKIWELPVQQYSGLYGCPVIAGETVYGPVRRVGSKCPNLLIAVAAKDGRILGEREGIGQFELFALCGDVLAQGGNLYAADPASLQNLGGVSYDEGDGEHFTSSCLMDGRLYLRGRRPGWKKGDERIGCLYCFDLDH
jgi:outer membrane protein assembly factor BamB